MNSEMDRQLDRIRRAYDLTVRQYELGVDQLANVPAGLKNTPEFQKFLDEAGESCNSGSPDVRAYLAPAPGNRFLDIGCAATLHTHRFFEWPSKYYGVDISSLLVEAMRSFAARNSIDVAGHPQHGPSSC